MNHGHYNHYIVMFFIMILSGPLSTMNVWADKWSDVRLSINDAYMTLLMTGWMFLFMGLYYREQVIVLIGAVLVAVNMWCIRTQFLVTNEQYVKGMIPHHSMAILMSKRLLENQPPVISSFVKSIVTTQEKEIQFLKRMESA
jgi:uncharacterized protein (DUF305 family)